MASSSSNVNTISGTADIDDLRFLQQFEQLHSFGPRPVAKLPAALDGRFLIRQPIEQLVEEYINRLDPETPS